MWQQVLAGVVVLGATLYALWVLAPKSWRKRVRGGDVAEKNCGCETGKGGCGSIR